MAIFRRHADAAATAFAWAKSVKTEQEDWFEERSEWKPWGEIGNVTSHQESYREPNGVLRARTWYTYESRRWRECRTLTSSGTGRGDVHWPQYALEPGERVFAKWETYSVTFSTPEKKYEKALDEPRWRALSPGATYRMTTARDSAHPGIGGADTGMSLVSAMRWHASSRRPTEAAVTASHEPSPG